MMKMLGFKELRKGPGLSDIGRFLLNLFRFLYLEICLCKKIDLQYFM